LQDYIPNNGKQIVFRASGRTHVSYRPARLISPPEDFVYAQLNLPSLYSPPFYTKAMLFVRHETKSWLPSGISSAAVLFLWGYLDVFFSRQGYSVAIAGFPDADVYLPNFSFLLITKTWARFSFCSRILIGGQWKNLSS